MSKLLTLVLAILFVSIGYTQDSMNVKATLYYPHTDQTDSTPYITASGRVINRNDPFLSKYIAVSGYMETLYPMGTKVRLTSQLIPELNGVYTVADRMNRRYDGTSLIDILVSEELYERLRYKSGIFKIEEI